MSGGKVPIHAGEMAVTRHARHDGFSYGCILASVTTNSLAWAFDSGRTIGEENLFLFVVFMSSPLISLCPSVTDTLVISCVTDIPRIL